MTAGTVGTVMWAAGSPARLGRRHPEAWVWGVAAVAWALMAVVHLEGTGDVHGITGHDHGEAASAPTVAGGHAATAAGLAPSLGLWTLMVLAMMLPTAAPALRAVAHASVPRRRVRSQLLFLTAYVGIWIGAGVVPVAAVQAWAPTESTRRYASVVLLLVAAAYALSRRKRWALARCQAVASLPPRGTPADRACLRVGARHAAWCLAGCWPLMAVVTVDGHATAVLTALVTATIWGERLIVARRRRLPRTVLPLLTAAVALAAW